MSNLLDDFIDWLGDVLARPGGADVPVIDADEPSMEGVKGKVVRLDVAITALCLLSARIYVKDLTEIIEKDLQTAERMGATATAAYALGKTAVKNIVSLITGAFTAFQGTQNQKAIGKKVSANWAKLDKDLRGEVLFTKRKRHKRKMVTSRNPK